MSASKKVLSLLIGFVISTGFAGLLSKHSADPATIDYYASDEKRQVIVRGIICEEPDRRREKTLYTVRTRYLRGTGNVNGLVLVSADNYPAYDYGDELELTGKLEKPAVFDGFDYAGYLSRYDIYAVMNRPRITPLPSPFSLLQTPNLFKLLLETKQSFENHLKLTFPTEPSSSLLAGLLLGSRAGIPEQLNKDFQTTGLSHIIAISGYNITLIATLLLSLLASFGKRTSRWLAGIGIIVFTIFVGASPAVVRACIMGIISLIALNTERKSNINIVVALTAAIMIGYNPQILWHDIGFQLSFLSMMGLIYVSPILEPYLHWLPKKLAIRDSVLLTLSAQIMALPVIALNFQKLSLVSPLSNLLIAGPIIPYTMLFGFLGTITSCVSLTLGKIIAFPGYLLVTYLTTVIHLTANIPYAAVAIDWFSVPILALYFFVLIILLIKHWRIRKRIEQRIIAFCLGYQHRIAHLAWGSQKI